MLYRTYGEIPAETIEYIKFVTHVEDIENIPLGDINGFFAGLMEFEQSRITSVVSDDR